MNRQEIEKIFEEIHEVYEEHDGGPIHLPHEKKDKIKELLSLLTKEPKQKNTKCRRCGT